MLSVRNLHANVVGKEILKGINLEVKAGEVHAIMGRNGSGKSTLAKTIAGEPHVEVTSGEILFNGKNLVGMEPEDRALAGVFIGFQYPVEIPGVNNAGFLRMAFNAKRKAQGQDEMDPMEFDEFLQEKIKLVEISQDFLDRSVNQGFSGGEKKKNEILQMAVLDPKLAILDETDSGLDVDALRTVAEGVNRLRKPDNAVVLVTHYQRILNYVHPHYVHILYEGKIIKSGGKDLALEVESRGYDWVFEELKGNLSSK
jgi:Fe-S cluster assembly ATP-binding protein